MAESGVYHAIERAFRAESGQVLATLIGWLGDFQLAEDALQDALVAALEHWARSGMPQRPGAWMTMVARRKAIDRLRRDTSRLGYRSLDAINPLLLAVEDQLDDLDDIPDERLKLMFTCCHPALPLDARLALTLHTLGGLTTAEIARAFLVPLPTMAQRLVRAKKKIREAGIPYEVPPAHRIGERLDAILLVIYLIFSEGYSASQGDGLIRHDLCDEATRLVQVLTTLLSRNQGMVPAAQYAETLGLHALLLLHQSRRHARLAPDGSLVLLAAQDRSRWDRAQIQLGQALLEKALTFHQPGTYQIQAAISALHAEAEHAEATDWPQIVQLYTELLRYSNTPVIALNRAVAVGMAEGPLAGLALVQTLEASGQLRDYYPLHVAHADLLRRAGQLAAARQYYLMALELCQNAIERDGLLRRLQELPPE